MARNESQPVVVKLLPSLGDFSFLLPIAFLFSRLHGTKALLGDCDTGWHIRTGEWILAHGHVPYQDIFSFTRSGQPWFAWEWLWDVIFALIFRKGGLALVVLVNLVLIAGLIALLYRLCCRYANPVLSMLIACTAAVASSIHWLARPHLMTLLFTILFLWMLERVEEGNSRLLWWLPPITILWTNLHGGFFVGIILVGGFAAGQMMTALLSDDGSVCREAWSKAVRYLTCAGACLLASLVNPYFYKLHVHVVEYLTDSYQKEHINEFFSLNFHHPVGPFFEALLLLGAWAAFWHASRGRYRALVLIAVWGHGALLSMRNIPLYAIISGPFIALALEDALRRIPNLHVAGWLPRAGRGLLATLDGIAEMEAVGRWHLVSVLTVAVIALLVFAPMPPKEFRPEYDPAAYPAGALRAMNFGPDARIFANDEWGDYLIFRLYERGTKVFVDGRSDFYGREFEEKYLDAYAVRYGWERTLRQYGINTILVPATASITGALKESSHWHVVYDDGVSLVFRPAAAGTGTQVSTATGGGRSRDREITKTSARDRTITVIKTKPTT